MIIDVKTGDIRSRKNPNSFIIGMNDTLEDVTAQWIPYIRDIKPTHPLQLGSVLNFQYDRDRMLHMLICHKIGFGGWEDSEKWVRLGLDYLWQTQQNPAHAWYCKNFSIVRIGTGQIGVRDGANAAEITRAMATSHLDLTLYVRDEQEMVPFTIEREPLFPQSTWHPVYGEEKLVPARAA
ncbi:MAG: hypothetical protein NTV02_01770 [Candidatus Zambryskibacteria bacterium]|nr:hypothetical protein [Candidatus Zambryskibacteria bacterium]